MVACWVPATTLPPCMSTKSTARICPRADVPGAALPGFGPTLAACTQSINRSFCPTPSRDIIDIVAQLLVRNLDDELVRALQVRAAEHGRSTEAEHREILKQALAKSAPRLSFKEFLESMPNVGDDADFERDQSSVGSDSREVDL